MQNRASKIKMLLLLNGMVCSTYKEIYCLGRANMIKTKLFSKEGIIYTIQQ